MVETIESSTKENFIDKKKSKMKVNQCYLMKIMKTFSFYLAFSVLGFSSPLIGVTMSHLEKIFDVNTQTISTAIVIWSTGYLLGSILCGLQFDKFNHELLFVIYGILAGIVTCSSGFLSNIYLFIVLMALQGVSFGFIDAAGQSYCMKLWSKSKLREPFIQGAHTVWSLGATLGPLIIELFLCELYSQDKNIEDSSNFLHTSTNLTLLIEPNKNTKKTIDSNLKYEVSFVNNSLETNNTDKVIEIFTREDLMFTKISYICVGSIIFMSYIPFICIYLIEYDYTCFFLNHHEIKSNKKDTIEKQNSELEKASESLKIKNSQYSYFKTILLTLLFFFYLFYISMEYLPGAYFSSFAIKQLDWSVNKASLLVSFFYGAHFIGSILGIPLSMYCKAGKMLAFNATITLIAFILLLLVNKYSNIIYLSALLGGLGLSTTNPSCILWTSETIPITGRVSSVMVCGSTLGLISGPLLVGYLFTHYSPLFLIYVLFLFSLADILLFFALLLTVKIFKKIKRNILFG